MMLLGERELPAVGLAEARGVAAFPALMVNGEIKSQGDFITVDDCEEMLSPYTK